MILHYDQLYHPNSRRCMYGTRSFVVVSDLYLPKTFINHYYHVVIFYLKNIKYISQNSQNRRSVETANSLFETYKNMWWHMGVINMQQHIIWTWLQYVHIYHPNIHFHTGNVCCVVVPISHILILHTKHQIGFIPTHIFQYISYISHNCMMYSAWKTPTLRK